jgi:MFS superfamily sulfate permease-like transporter
VAAAAIALVLVFLTGPIRYAPTAALGAVLVRSAISLVDVRALRELLRIDRREFLLALLTMLGVVWFGAIDAVLLAVLLALLRFVRVAARPDVALLGMQAGVRGIHDLRNYPDAQAPPGLVLVRFDGPLAFFNAAYLKDRVLAAASAAGPGLRAVIIDATAFSMRADTTAVIMLVELRDTLALRGVELALAGKRTFIQQWRRERGFTTESVGDEPRVRLFSTLEDAVDAFAGAPRGDEAWIRQR